MPTILLHGPYRFFFVALDRGEPPHVHVQREKFVAKFWLDPIVLAKGGGFSPTELRTIFRIVEANRSKFLEKWNEFFIA